MLNGGGNACTDEALHIGLTHCQHAVGVVAVGADVGDGVLEVHVDVHDGRIGDVDTQCRTFHAADTAQAAGLLHLTSGSHQHLTAHIGALIGDAAAAVFQVGGDDQGDGRVLLQGIDSGLHFLGGVGAEHDAAPAVLGNGHLQIPGVIAVEKGAHELLYLLVLGHVGEGLLHPCDLTIVKAEGFCFQIDVHVSIPSPFFFLANSLATLPP